MSHSSGSSSSDHSAGDPASQPETYRNPAVTVDGVVLARSLDERPDAPLSVLLIERGCEPFQGQYALPGGFVEYGEDIDTAVHREVEEETGLSGLDFLQFGAYGHPDRDPRGHTVSIVYVARIEGTPSVQGGDDAAAAAWFPVDRLPPLAFDHGFILAHVLQSPAEGQTP